jgi:superfamily II DNA or RNA helicase
MFVVALYPRFVTDSSLSSPQEVVRASLKSKRSKKCGDGAEKTPLADILRRGLSCFSNTSCCYHLIQSRLLVVAVVITSTVDDMIDQAVTAWKGLCRDRKTICFCVDIEHSKAVAAGFLSSGVRACHIDGSTPEKCGVCVACSELR